MNCNFLQFSLPEDLKHYRIKRKGEYLLLIIMDVMTLSGLQTGRKGYKKGKNEYVENMRKICENDIALSDIFLSKVYHFYPSVVQLYFIRSCFTL